MNILAADDEEGALKILVRILSGVCPGAEIAAFQDPHEALAYAGSHAVDVAFLDIRMPEMSGLDLARRLKAILPRINLIFTTGYDDYAVDAIRLRSSGYLLKPVTAADVRAELDAMRNPVEEKPACPLARTFGYFDLIVNGTPLAFHREKAKEVLAFLIDLRGSFATRKQIAAVLFEDSRYSRTNQAYLTQIINSLRGTLEEAGIPELLLSDRNQYAVRTDALRCDSWDYLQGDVRALNAFHGEYMSQYSWGEERLGKFL